MAGLAGHAGGVGVEALGKVRTAMRTGRVTVFTQGIVRCLLGVTASLQAVGSRGMAESAALVQSVDAHMHVQLPRRIRHRRIQIPMFHSVAAPTVKVATTTALTAGLAHAARHGGQVHRGIRRTCAGGGLLIGTGSVVADEAVDVLRIAEVERVIPPADPDVATGATRLVGAYGHAVIVDDVDLT